MRADKFVEKGQIINQQSFDYYKCTRKEICNEECGKILQIWKLNEAELVHWNHNAENWAQSANHLPK
jgi:hypothetical protein